MTKKNWKTKSPQKARTEKRKRKGINRELDPGAMFHDNSEMIGTDIDDLQNVITEREFQKMFIKCECGHYAPPEFVYTDGELYDTCANCVIEFLKEQKTVKRNSK